MTENEISKILVDLSIMLHKTYGPGLFESVYESLLCYELDKLGIPYKNQQGISLIHEEIKLDIGFRADLIVDDKVIVEIKSVENILPVHKKQVLTYLKLSNLKLGLLVNFNVDLMKEGITRLVNNL